MTAKKPPAKKAAARKPPTKRAPAKPRVTARDRKVLELRNQGIAFEAIAKTLKFRGGRDQVHDSYDRALAETLERPADEIRRRRLAELDAEMSPLWKKAIAGDLAATRQLGRLSDERTRVIGDGSPLKQEVASTGPGQVEKATSEEINRLGQGHHTLAATALTMARLCDESTGNAMAAATAARELRQNMAALRAISVDASTRPRAEGDNVVPLTRLATLRSKHEARGATTS